MTFALPHSLSVGTWAFIALVFTYEYASLYVCNASWMRVPKKARFVGALIPHVDSGKLYF